MTNPDAVIPPGAADKSIFSRRQRAAVKAELRSGTLSLSAALHEPIQRLGDMPTYELLLAVPRLSKGRLAILNEAAMYDRVNLCLPVVVLTERQRNWIVDKAHRVCYTDVWEELRSELRSA